MLLLILKETAMWEKPLIGASCMYSNQRPNPQPFLLKAFSTSSYLSSEGIRIRDKQVSPVFLM